MSLYEDWIKIAYDKDGKSNKAAWDDYMPQEQKIYEEILETKNPIISGTVKALSSRYQMKIEFICGFIDGINEAIVKPVKVDTLTPDDFISMEVDYEKLYKKMVEYKAEHLYNLPQWDNVFTVERRKEMYYEQKRSGTVLKEEKPGRNDPCPCGSGKKYKKCCGANA